MTDTPGPGITPPLIQVTNVTVRYATRQGTVDALDDVTLTVREGEIVAVVGESGAGKSSLVLTLLDLLPDSATVVSGSATLGDIDLLHPNRVQRQRIRGGLIGYVPQDPTVSLSPVRTVGQQIVESLHIHRADVPAEEATEVAARLLGEVGIDEPRRRLLQYPHELSGGMRQRVLIAIALSSRPVILVADEATSGLDVTVQRRVLDQLEASARSDGRAVLFITHDLAVAAERADRIVVMRAGRIVEQGATAQVLSHPTSAYTRELLDASPSFHDEQLDEIDELIPHLASSPSPEPILQAREVEKVFDVRSPDGSRTRHFAVDKVSLELHRGATTALVGESGSGKTTVARILAGLVEPTAGEVLFEGRHLDTRVRRGVAGDWRTSIQYVYQNPYSSLDPRYTVERLLAEPLETKARFGRRRRSSRVAELLDAVALPGNFTRRRPHELSGGQLQRVAIARALAVEPSVIVLDEPVSALDVTVQAKILELLRRLQREFGLAYLLISHDLAVVRQIAHSVAVMRAGVIVERGPTTQVLGSPHHSFTRELVDAIPSWHRHTHANVDGATRPPSDAEIEIPTVPL